MLDEKDLQAIANLIDAKLDVRLAPLQTELVKINLTIENSIQPQIQMLVEGQHAILEKLVPRSRVDDLEEEVRFLKTLFRQMSEEVQQLKKAN